MAAHPEDYLLQDFLAMILHRSIHLSFFDVLFPARHCTSKCHVPQACHNFHCCGPQQLGFSYMALPPLERSQYKAHYQPRNNLDRRRFLLLLQCCLAAPSLHCHRNAFVCPSLHQSVSFRFELRVACSLVSPSCEPSHSKSVHEPCHHRTRLDPHLSLHRGLLAPPPESNNKMSIQEPLNHCTCPHPQSNLL